MKLRCEERFDGEITYKWVVYKATTSFGRILLNQIDPETGKKKGKGIAVKDYVVNFYLKIALTYLKSATILKWVVAF